MEQDRSLRDLIKFLDPSGSISDADIAGLSSQLKFTEVLDLISNVGKDNIDDARNILNKYDSRFTVAKEYSSVPTKKPGGFKPIAPQGSVGQLPSTGGAPAAPATQTAPQSAMAPQGSMGAQTTTGPQGTAPGAQGQEQDVNDLLANPANKNAPEVKQIQSLLQRLQNR
jgi:hypothetical protein